ncbi:MAG: YcfL family protein [Magnetococcales bacterium]|nr:YcfL family protein [Magnetococcales bacterium]MBF0113615.1 YcfL family protein [Magnetococcales bacterium]
MGDGLWSKWVLGSGMVVVMVGLAACQPPPQRSAAIASKVEELGVMLDVQPVELRVVRRNNLLHVQAEVFNPTTQDQSVSYRFRWVDAAGFVLDEEAWKPLLLHGQQRQFLRTVAPAPQAVDFRLEMHAPNNSVPVDIAANQPRQPWNEVVR